MANADLILTEADDGKTISPALGAVFVVTLPENASTGFRWEPDGLDMMMIDVVDVTHLPRSATVGGGGNARWTLRTKKPGNTQVRFKLWRPWEGEASIQKRFGVTLAIGR